MLTIYHSNQLNLLKDITASLVIEKPIRDPFQSEIIQIQNNDMAKWMQIELASQLGISANIKFLLSNSFIWKMFTLVLPDIPAESIFSKSAMKWKIMMLLPYLCKQPNFTMISKYLHDDDDKRKCFQFATQVANLFDQYLVFHPDWLESWKHGKLIEGLGDAQYWQALLWQTLITETKKTNQPLCYHGNLYPYFIKTLVESQIRPPGLPDRVFIFDTTLTPIYLQALQALSYHIDIYIMFINPCRYYWRNINNCAFFKQLSLHKHQYYQQQTDQTLFQYSKHNTTIFYTQKKQQNCNPLLASWGKNGRDKLHLLMQLKNIKEVDAFIEPVENNLLNILQRDILDMEDHTVINTNCETLKYSGNKRLLQPKDRSLSLHACHSTLREVEVLHDNLLRMMMADPTLQPRDVIVMMVDVDRYTPAIQSVFGNTCGGRYLPFIISDRLLKHSHSVLTVFLSLLELPNSRFTTEQILALLEEPALATKFNINEQKLQLLRRWVVESGIRWGLDDNTLRDLMLPVTGQHTWRFGLIRMLLGYAMTSQSGHWQGILPYDESSGLIADLVGDLAEFLMRLCYWRTYLAQLHSLDTWKTCIHEMINDFFIPDDGAASVLTLIKNQWQQMLEHGTLVGYLLPISITLLRDELSARLDQKRDNHRFLDGTINFCTLIAMRSIPFKVICLLGMNDGIYPRTIPIVDFDLIAQHSQYGDYCNQRDDDRYFFLKVLLAAQQQLYISFIGYDIQDNTRRYPSVLINELSDYIAQSFYLSGDEYTDIKISARKVHKHLCQWHSRTPFAAENFLPGSERQSFASEWLAAASAKGKPYPNFVCPIKTISFSNLSLDDLRNFYHHPVRTWFQKRLAVYFRQTSLKMAINEPFVVDKLTSYQINNRLINILIDNQSTDQLYHQVCAEGLLPYGSFGKLYWIKQCQIMTKLAKQVQIYRLPKNKNKEVFLKIGNIELYGWLQQVQENGLLRWKPGNISVKDGFLLWLEHLVYCAMEGKGESRVLGTFNAWHFASISADQAKSFLHLLISGYCNGMISPLLLLNKSGGAWLTNCFDWQTKKINWNENRQRYSCYKLIQAWHGCGFTPGDSNDPYLQRIIYQLEKKHIKEIISEAERYLLPIFIFNLAKNNLTSENTM